MITVLSPQGDVRGTYENKVPNATPYFEDKLLDNLETEQTTLEFAVPLQSPDSKWLEGFSTVLYPDKDGVLRELTVINVWEDWNREEPLKRVVCEDSSVDILLKTHVVPFTAGSLEEAIRGALMASPWEYVIGEDTANIGYYLVDVKEYTDVRSVLETIKQTYGIEYRFSARFDGRKLTRVLNVAKQFGADTGKYFIYDRDLVNIERTIDYDNIHTSVITYWQEDDVMRTLAGYNPVNKISGFRKDLSSDQIYHNEAHSQYDSDDYGKVLIMKSSSTDPELSYLEACNKLLDYIAPTYTYNVNVHILENALGFEGTEQIHLGDTVWLKEKVGDMELGLSARVIQLTTSHTNPEEDEVIFTNFKEIDVADSAEVNALRGMIQQIQEQQDNISQTVVQVTENITQLQQGQEGIIVSLDGKSSISVGATPNPNPKNGDTWFTDVLDPATGKTYSATKVWVEATQQWETKYSAKDAEDAKAAAIDAAQAGAEAKAAADAAKVAADEATAAGDEALAKVEQATVDINSAKDRINSLEIGVVDLTDNLAATDALANVAKDNAALAQTAANTAQTAAQEAKAAADEAQGTANAALTSAGSAGTAAQEAKTAATNAHTAANNAQEAANTAGINAQKAIEDAQTAFDKAEANGGKIQEVVETVDGITSTVALVKTTADSALSKATTVETTVNGVKTTVAQVQEDLEATDARVTTNETSIGGIKTSVSQVKTTADSALSKATTTETTVNGLKTTITSVETTANSALTKANTAQSTADGNKTTIASVKTTADSALTKANTVEQTVDGISTTLTSVQEDLNGNITKVNEISDTVDGHTSLISSVTTTAGNALSKANTAQSTADGNTAKITAVTTTANNALTKANTVQQTVDGQQTTITSIQNDLANASRGSRNLLRNSSMYENTTGWSISSDLNGVIKDGYLLLDKTVTTSSRATLNYNTGNRLINDIEPDTEYSLGFAYYVEAVTQAQDSNNVFLRTQYGTTTTYDLPIYNFDFSETGVWKWAFANGSTQTGSISGATFTLALGQRAIARIRVKEFILVKGKNVKDWSPATLDLATVTQVNQITDTVDSHTQLIASTTATANSALTKATSVEQTADGLKTSVSAVKTTADSALSKATTTETTVNGLSTKITSVENTANSAVTKANTAQSTADGNKATIASVKTTADSALSKATTVETTVNGLKTTVGEVKTTADGALQKATQVEQTAEGLKTTITAVEMNVNRMDGGGSNLISNGGFENDYVGWTQPFGFTVTTDESHSGSKSLAIGNVGSTGRAIGRRLTVPVVPGRKYEVSYWYKTTADANGVSGNQKLRIGKIDGSLINALGWEGASTEWTKMSQIYTAGTDIYEWSITLTASHKVGTVWWDDVSIIDVTDREVTNAQITQISATVDGLTTTVSQVKTTADSALSKATSVEQTANGLTTTVATIQTDIVDLTNRFPDYNFQKKTPAPVLEGANLTASYDAGGLVLQNPATSGSQRAYWSLSGLALGKTYNIKIYANVGQSTVRRDIEVGFSGGENVKFSFENTTPAWVSGTAKSSGNGAALSFWIPNGGSLRLRELYIYEANTNITSSQITQLSDNINLKVDKNGVIAQINVSSEGVLIDGKNIWITGLTKIDNAVIKTAAIADLAVTTAKIANLAVGTAQIGSAAITEAKIGNLAVTTAKIADLAVTNAKIGSLSANKITTGTLDAGVISVINLNASNIKSGTLSGLRIESPYDVPIASGATTNRRGSLVITDGYLRNVWQNYVRSSGSVTSNGELTLNHEALTAVDRTGAGTTTYNTSMMLHAGGLTLQNYAGQGGTLSFQDLYSRPMRGIIPASGWSQYNSDPSSPNFPTQQRNGRVVQIAGAFRNNNEVASGSENNLMGTLDVGYRPATDCNFIVQASGSNIYLLTVKANGQLLLARHRGWANNRWGDVAVGVGSWLNIASVFAAADV